MTTVTNLEEYTNSQLRQKCLYYGFCIPITKESRQKVIDKLRQCISKENEKKLKKQTLASTRKNKGNNPPEKLEKFNFATTQLNTTSRMVGTSVLQELRKKEKKLFKKRAAAAKEMDNIKKFGSDSSFLIPFKTHKIRPSLEGVFGLSKLKENLATKSQTMEDKAVEKNIVGFEKIIRPDIKTHKLLKPKQNIEKKSNKFDKGLTTIDGDLGDGEAVVDNKSFTIASNGIKQTIDNLAIEGANGLGDGKTIVANKSFTIASNGVKETINNVAIKGDNKGLKMNNGLGDGKALENNKIFTTARDRVRETIDNLPIEGDNKQFKIYYGLGDYKPLVDNKSCTISSDGVKETIDNLAIGGANKELKMSNGLGDDKALVNNKKLTIASDAVKEAIHNLAIEGDNNEINKGLIKNFGDCLGISSQESDGVNETYVDCNSNNQASAFNEQIKCDEFSCKEDSDDENSDDDDNDCLDCLSSDDSRYYSIRYTCSNPYE